MDRRRPLHEFECRVGFGRNVIVDRSASDRCGKLAVQPSPYFSRSQSIGCAVRSLDQACRFRMARVAGPGSTKWWLIERRLGNSNELKPRGVVRHGCRLVVAVCRLSVVALLGILTWLFVFQGGTRSLDHRCTWPRQRRHSGQSLRSLGTSKRGQACRPSFSTACATGFCSSGPKSSCKSSIPGPISTSPTVCS